MISPFRIELWVSDNHAGNICKISIKSRKKYRILKEYACVAEYKHLFCRVLCLINIKR